MVLNTPSKSALSVGRKRLLETMQRLNFGRIEGLVVQSGEPTFVPLPRIVRDIKIGAQTGPRPELVLDDFTLKSHAAELFDHMAQLSDGSVALIEVKHGLPFRLVIELDERGHHG